MEAFSVITGFDPGELDLDEKVIALGEQGVLSIDGIVDAVVKHSSYDFGYVDQETVRQNVNALFDGAGVIRSIHEVNGVRLQIITMITDETHSQTEVGFLSQRPPALFEGGKVGMTAAVAAEIDEDTLLGLEDITALLDRHFSGDFGDLCQEDIQENLRGIRDGDRIISSYRINALHIWVITEWDRSYTTVLFPEDY